VLSVSLLQYAKDILLSVICYILCVSTLVYLYAQVCPLPLVSSHCLCNCVVNRSVYVDIMCVQCA
jgi:hypothetical protein